MSRLYVLLYILLYLLALLLPCVGLGFLAGTAGVAVIEQLQLHIPGSSIMLGFFLVVSTIVLILLLGAFAITRSTPVPKWRRKGSPLHLLVVLGSGGHTAEIFTMLYRMDLCPSKYAYRTYLVSSGDNFSAAKAVEYEIALRERGAAPASYVIVTVPRARRVHQSYFTAPFSTLLCFRSCFLALCRRHPDQRRHGLPEQLTSPYPDLILTNGPATAVCAVLAARILRLCHGRLSLLFPGMADAHPSTTGAEPDGSNPMVDELRLRTIFVESWARVKTLSLSGKILLPFADRFLVQWPALEGKRVWWGMKRAQYVPGLMG